MREILHIYRFFWLDGKIEESKAKSLAQAFTNLGYDAGARYALDYWVKVK